MKIYLYIYIILIDENLGTGLIKEVLLYLYNLKLLFSWEYIKCMVFFLFEYEDGKSEINLMNKEE